MSRTRAVLIGIIAIVVLVATGQLLVQAADVPHTGTAGRPVAAPTAPQPVPPRTVPQPVTVPPVVPTDAVPPESPATTAAESAPETSASKPPAAPLTEPKVPELPKLRAPYETVLGFHGDGKVAYLTFDDGPSPTTAQVLDVLDRSGVKATFCQIGSQIGDFPDVERRIITDGHTLCNHSWTHPANIATLSEQDIDQQIARTQQVFTDYGVTGHYFRAPGGDFGTTTTTLRQLCQRYQALPLGWGVDSLDWTKPGPAKIVQNVLNTVSPGAVILLHDGGGTTREQTITALPGIITGLQQQGYTLAALPPGGLS